MKLQQLLSVGLLCFGLTANAQKRPTLNEKQECNDPKKTTADCSPKELKTKKSYTNAGKEMYVERYDSAGVLQGVSVDSSSGVTTKCSLDSKSRLFCEWVDLLDQTGISSKVKPGAPVFCHSDKELSDALGVKEASISALGIDWRFSQVVVFAPTRPKPGKGFMASQGEAYFVASKDKTGELILPFTETCPPKIGKPTTPPTLVAAFLPADFTVTTVKAKLSKAGYDGSQCMRRP